MVGFAGLTTSQTPPMAVPMRFFLTAPLFMVAGGLLLILAQDALWSSRWSPQVLALTHLWVLGIGGMVMFGALQQVVPVLLGAPLPRPTLVAQWAHGLLVIGIPALVGGFLTAESWLFSWAAAFLGAAFSLLVIAAGMAVRRGRAGPSRWGMAGALAALAVTVALGVRLALGQGGWLPLARQWTDLHLTWGLLGWSLLLLSAVAWQVVPMFQVTPKYPRWLAWSLAPWLGLALSLWTFTTDAGRQVAAVMFALALIAFAVTTLWLQWRRKRPVMDANLAFWRLSMIAFLGAVATEGLRRFGVAIPEVVPGLLLVMGGLGGAIFGMWYRIVPFLIWLHLSNVLQERGELPRGIPNMKQIIPARRPWALFWLYLTWLGLMLAGVWYPEGLAVPAGLLLVTMGVVLEWHLVAALVLYRRERRRIG